MVMLRRFSQLVAQQPKTVVGFPSRYGGNLAKLQQARAGSPQTIVKSTQELNKPLDDGNMTATGMYNWRVAAVNNALAKRGKEFGPLTVEDLTSLGHLDQYHYMGTEACDEAIQILGLNKESKVLDIGSGIGGPARYMAMKSGSDFTGVELQHDLNVAATDLTERVGLHDKVRFVTGDFLHKFQTKDPSLLIGFDHMISFLVILHVADRPALLQAASDSLKPGGTFLIEDFALVGDHFTPAEVTNLKSVVSAHTVTSNATYIAELEAAGFTDIEVDDLSEPWRKWTKARHESYRASREETIKMHGEKLYNDRVHFYEIIDELFSGGNLGGVRITGRKKGAQGSPLHRGPHVKQGETKAALLNELGSKVSGSE